MRRPHSPAHSGMGEGRAPSSAYIPPIKREGEQCNGAVLAVAGLAGCEWNRAAAALSLSLSQESERFVSDALLERFARTRSAMRTIRRCYSRVIIAGASTAWPSS